MARKFKSLLNLTTLPSDPSGSEGDVFFNTSEKALKIHNGITWVSIVKSDDPTPFYMHTHSYDGNVHTIDVQNIVTFKEINNEEPPTVEEELPIIVGFEGGTPSSTYDPTPTFNELTSLDGGEL